MNSASSPSKTKAKTVGAMGGCSSLGFERVLERESASL